MGFIDRIVQYPGRVKLTPVAGQSNVYDMTRQEGTITQEGTKLNSEEMDECIEEIVKSMINDCFDSNGKFTLKKYVQAGKATVKTKDQANKTISLSVSFPKAFSTTPIVVVSPISSTPNNVRVSIQNISTTGFTVYAYRTNSQYDTNIRWIAVAV